MFLTDDDRSSSDFVSSPTPPPPSKKNPKNQGKKKKTGKKVANKHLQEKNTSEEYYTVLADGTNGVVAPAGRALPAASGTATTRRKETRPRVCSKCHQPGHNARSCQTGNPEW